ncbi:MAG: hypothetical protein ACRCVX_13730 [Shewanella sp.]
MLANAGSGAYGLSGFPAFGIRARNVNAEPASYALSGAQAVGLRSIVGAANAGAYSLLGQPAFGAVASGGGNAEPGGYSLIGFPAFGEYSGGTQSIAFNRHVWGLKSKSEQPYDINAERRKRGITPAIEETQALAEETKAISDIAEGRIAKIDAALIRYRSSNDVAMLQKAEQQRRILEQRLYLAKQANVLFSLEIIRLKAYMDQSSKKRKAALLLLLAS